MFYATTPEKLALLSILLKSFEKISSGQDGFDESDIDELSDPYLFLQPQNYSKKEKVPSNFLQLFKSFLYEDYWKKKFESNAKEDSLLINDVELCRIKIEIVKEITQILNAHYFIEDALEIVLDNFKKESDMCDLLIRVVESFSHYIVVSNLGLPLSKIEKSRSLECESPRPALYNLLEESKDIPEFIVLLQRRCQNDELGNPSYLTLNEGTGEEAETFVIKAGTLGEISKNLINRFKYNDVNFFKKYGVWFPPQLYHCSKCNKLQFSLDSHNKKYCIGRKDRHIENKMEQFTGIILNKNLSQVFPYFSEYLAIHVLRQLFYENKLFGFFFTFSFI